MTDNHSSPIERDEMLRSEDQVEIDKEMEQGRTIRSVVFSICISLIIVVAIIVGGYYFTNRVAMEKGLCQGSIPGASGWHWVQCAPK